MNEFHIKRKHPVTTYHLMANTQEDKRMQRYLHRRWDVANTLATSAISILIGFISAIIVNNIIYESYLDIAIKYSFQNYYIRYIKYLSLFYYAIFLGLCIGVIKVLNQNYDQILLSMRKKGLEKLKKEIPSHYFKEDKENESDIKWI